MLRADRLRQVVNYNRDTGEFTRRVRGPGRSGPVGSHMGCANSKGYDRIMVDGVSYLSHRLAWLYEYGAWPVAELDHINCNQRDNRIANLREATRAQNCRNTRTPKNNSSGLKGVSFNRNHGLWVASISCDGNQQVVGRFDSKEAAYAAYCAAAVRLHGEFARAA